MRPSSTMLARACLYTMGLGHPILMIFMIAAIENTGIGYLFSFASVWQEVLYFGCVLLPALSASLDDHRLYLLGAGVFTTRMLLELVSIVPSSTTALLAFTPFYIALIGMSIWLAVEKVAIDASADILCLGWSPNYN